MNQPLFDLTGRIAFISGSSRGIGFTIAQAFAEAGAELVINSRNADSLEEARDRLSANGAKVTGLAFDVTDHAAVEAGVARIEAEVGPIDIAVCNAGIQRRAAFVDIPADTWRDVMATNLDAVFFVGQAVARHMVPRQRGKIINVCSLASEVGRPSITPYVTSKGAVKMLTKSMCTELAGSGIQVNGMGPGYFKTDLNVDLFNDTDFNTWVKSRTPAGRWGELEELKGTAVFLASDASNFVNGQIIYIDGGLLSGM